MKRILSLLPLVLAATFLAASPAAADDRRCDGAIGATHVDGNVIVPNGATCTLRGTRIDGNVFVRGNATLVARGVKVGGNIQADDHRRVLVTVRTVDDNTVRSRVAGDIQVEDGGRAKVLRAVIGGNLQSKQNGGEQVARRNTIDGDLQAFSNKGGVRIHGNTIDGNLQCKSNDPAPVGDDNKVSGDKENQCRGF